MIIPGSCELAFGEGDVPEFKERREGMYSETGALFIARSCAGNGRTFRNEWQIFVPHLGCTLNIGPDPIHELWSLRDSDVAMQAALYFESVTPAGFLESLGGTLQQQSPEAKILLAALSETYEAVGREAFVKYGERE